MIWKVRNWDTFQHYKQRDPPWIKLHKRLINEREFHVLSGDDAKALILIWLIASERGGVLPIKQNASNALAQYNEFDDLAFTLRMKSEDIPQLLQRLNHWLEQDASASIALAKQDASKPLDRGEEKEGEERKETNLSEATSSPLKQEAALASSRSGLPLTRAAKQETNGQFQHLTLSDFDCGTEFTKALTAAFTTPDQIRTASQINLIKRYHQVIHEKANPAPA
jgi:hypothetical protein